MHIFSCVEEANFAGQPIILTIGTFDGVHRGHAFILQRASFLAQQLGGLSCALTFSNHPSQVLSPKRPTPLLCTLSHKIKLLEQSGLDALILLPFTREFAEQTPRQFIQILRAHTHFSHLILGHDAVLGKNRQGDHTYMQALAQEFGFQIEYIDEYKEKNLSISSTRIRQLIQQGRLEEASHLLGRPYSIYSKVLEGIGQGKLIGFPTANLDVQGLCLPPYGVYAVKIQRNHSLFPGIANLGIAPTLKNTDFPILEVHLFSEVQDLYGQEIEVYFQEFIRPERKFATIQDLKDQIQLDVYQAKSVVVKLPKEERSS